MAKRDTKPCEETSGPTATLGEKIRFLLRNTPRPGDDPADEKRKEYTQKELADFVRARTGKGTTAYLSLLVNDQRAGVSFKVIDAISEFFAVKPHVFSDGYQWSEEEVLQQIRLRASVHRHADDDLALEAARALEEMDPETRLALRPTLTYILEARKNPDLLRRVGDVTIFGSTGGEPDEDG